MIQNYLHITELCGLLLNILLYLLFKVNNGNNTKNVKAYYFKKLIILNLFFCISDVTLSVMNNVQMSGIPYIITNLLDTVIRIWILQYVILYIISLMPIHAKEIKTSEKRLLKFFIPSEAIMITGIIVSYFYGDTMEKNNLLLPTLDICKYSNNCAFMYSNCIL